VLTFFTCPKAFRGDSDRLQRNAIASWKQVPGCEILLFGTDEGTREAAEQLGAVHIPELGVSPSGIPLISDLFARAQQLATHDRLCYINSDIILMSDFTRALEQVQSLSSPVVAIGECLDIQVPYYLDGDDANWQRDLTRRALTEGKSRGRSAMDFFIFRRGFYRDIPPFVIGRRWFDNWLVWKARTSGAWVLDLTPSVVAVHQNHDYSHAGGAATVFTLPSKEVLENLRMAGGYWHLHGIQEATHKLTAEGVRRHWPGTFKLHFYLRRPWTLLWHWFLDQTRPLRHALGLRAGSLKA